MADSSSSFSVSGLPGLAQMAEGLMQEQFTWGQQQFAQNSQLTDQVVGDMLNLYSSMSGIGNTLMGMYQQAFVPEYHNLVQDANNYSSQARIQQAMGSAESGVAQNFNGQRDAALADLQSFGIDPSSGRYAQLDSAERMQEAAAAAGAGFQAEQSTEATGRALRSEALQLGSVMPSQATAAYGAANGAATSAENAKLANSQEGVNMMGSPIQWGQLANMLKSSGSSSSKSNPTPPKQNSNNNGNNRGNGQQGPSAPTPTMAPNTDAMGDQGGIGNGQGAPSAAIHGANGAPQAATDDNGAWNPGATSTPSYLDPSQNQSQDPWGAGVDSGPGMDVPQMGDGDNQLPSDFQGGLANDPVAENGQNPNPWPSQGDNSFNPSDDSAANQGTGVDTPLQDQGSLNDAPSNPAPPDQSASSDDSQGSPDQSFADNSGGDQGSFDMADQGDTGGFDEDDSQSAATGGVLQATHGAIPYSRSPSNGRVTDDVRAKLNDTGEDVRLNAGEFVIPRHTVAWKGEEHFQKLIAKSKRDRAKATAKPTMKPALPQRGAIPTRMDRHV